MKEGVKVTGKISGTLQAIAWTLLFTLSDMKLQEVSKHEKCYGGQSDRRGARTFISPIKDSLCTINRTAMSLETL